MMRWSSFDGRELAYTTFGRGDGPLVLLLHGFAADHRANWVTPGVVDVLVAAGWRAVAADARGHGESAKPHDPAAYGDGAMVRDAAALLDHLGIEAAGSVDVVGYSMGAIVAAEFTARDARVRALVLGGIGGSLVNGRPAGRRSEIADALTADDPRAVPSIAARAFRRFAERNSADLAALAAIQRAPRPHRVDRLHDITVPTLVVAGAGDTLAGDPQGLADVIPNATARIVRGNHLSAVNDPAFASAIVEFLRAARA
jgi:pimeloyl-ACP methyl ester carboxylesterase